jgi:tetratricopeptide (TPR) repeat protein
LGEVQKALKDFNEAIKRDSSYREAYYNRGIAYEKLGNYKKAVNDYNQALLIYNFSGHSWFEAAFIQSLSVLMVRQLLLEVMTGLSNYGT